MRLLVGVVPREHSAALGLTGMSPADGQQRPTSVLLTSSSSEVEVQSSSHSKEERLLKPRELEPEEGCHATGKQFVASVPSLVTNPPLDLLHRRSHVALGRR